MSRHRSLQFLFMSLMLFALIEGCNTKSQKTDVPSTNTVNLKSLDSLNWLVGTWRRHNGADTAFETWQQVSDNAIEGFAWENVGNDTSVTERLKIISSDSGDFYVADVAHNQMPVYFRLVSYQDGKFTFENPAHDFPTRIIYWPIRDDSLYARIEGTRQGKETGINFLFERVQ